MAGAQSQRRGEGGIGNSGRGKTPRASRFSTEVHAGLLLKEERDGGLAEEGLPLTHLASQNKSKAHGQRQLEKRHYILLPTPILESDLSPCPCNAGGQGGKPAEIPATSLVCPTHMLCSRQLGLFTKSKAENKLRRIRPSLHLKGASCAARYSRPGQPP